MQSYLREVWPPWTAVGLCTAAGIATGTGGLPEVGVGFPESPTRGGLWVDL